MKTVDIVYRYAAQDAAEAALARQAIRMQYRCYRSRESSAEDLAMAEINKLSVGQALDKLRGTEAPKARMTQLDDKIGALEEETRRMKEMNRRLERSQRIASTEGDAQETNVRRVTTQKIIWIVVGIVFAIPILAWALRL